MKPIIHFFALFWFCGQQHPVPRITYFFKSLGFGRYFPGGPAPLQWDPPEAAVRGTTIELIVVGASLSSRAERKPRKRGSASTREITGQSDKVTFFTVDLCDMQALENVFAQCSKIDALIHFPCLKAVGESVSRPLDYFENNLGDTFNFSGYRGGKSPTFSLTHSASHVAEALTSTICLCTDWRSKRKHLMMRQNSLSHRALP